MPNHKKNFLYILYENLYLKNKSTYQRQQKLNQSGPFLSKDALLKQGWIKKNKSYTNSRRVTLVKGNYIVVILIFKKNKARFITAYEIDNDENLEDIKSSPDWT